VIPWSSAIHEKVNAVCWLSKPFHGFWSLRYHGANQSGHFPGFDVRGGEIWVGSLNPNRGAEVGKIRPVLIIQTDFLIAQGAPTIIVLPLTTQVRQAQEPLHITIEARDRLLQACQVVPAQPRILDRKRLVDGPLTTLRSEELLAVERSLAAVLGLYV
jgi:mRNA interferase MazF